jgi:integrase
MPCRKPVPSYLNHAPSGRARVRIDGKDHYLGPYGSEESKAEYDRLVRKWLGDRAKDELAAKVQITNDLTVCELMLAYLQHAKTYYTKNGRETPEYGNVCLALRPVRERHGHELVTAFGPLKLKTIRQEWVEAGLVRAQINARVNRVRRMIAWGVEEELVPSSVLEALKAIKGLRQGRTEAREGKKVQPVDDAAVDAVKPFVSRQIWTMIELQRLTGMRPAEVRIMRTCDITTSGPTWTYKPQEHKTQHHGRERVIHLGPKAQEILRPWLRPELTAYLFQPREAEAERHSGQRKTRKTPVQPSQRNRGKKRPRRMPGDRYTKDTYIRAIARACDLAFPHPTLSPLTVEDLSTEQREQCRNLRQSLRGKDLSVEQRQERTVAIQVLLRRKLTPSQRTELKTWREAHRWRPNQIRHTVGTRVRAAMGLDAAQTVLGHAKANVTEHYAEANAELARQAMVRFG